MRTSSVERPLPPRPRGGPAAPGEPAADPAAPAYRDADLDGLFTYCLSVMCEHDAATAALGEALALAERQHGRGRRPADPASHRPWLYALVRWVCLRRLDAQQQERRPPAPRAGGREVQRRRRELAALAWPEAAGTRPEQREALELAVRHQLSVGEVAQVLRVAEAAANALLVGAAREVARTDAALAAAESGGCPEAAALAGAERDRMRLGPAARRELVRHVDGCPGCHRVAQQATVGEGGTRQPPGRAERTDAAAGRLAVLRAPRSAVHAARLAVPRGGPRHMPRFDRSGFPQEEQQRAARRERLRHRAMATTVVVTVVAAPALALWAAYRGAPSTGEPLRDNAAATTDDEPEPEEPGADGGAGRPGGAPSPGAGERSQERERGGARRSPDPSADAERGEQDPDPDPDATGTGDADGGGQGRLEVEAVSVDGGTRLTLTETSGDASVRWSVATRAEWLRLSGTSGTLPPGGSVTVMVAVDREREPVGPWHAEVTTEPSGTVVTLQGEGREADAEPEPDPDPTGPPPDDGEDGDEEAPEEGVDTAGAAGAGPSDVAGDAAPAAR